MWWSENCIDNGLYRLSFSNLEKVIVCLRRRCVRRRCFFSVRGERTTSNNDTHKSLSSSYKPTPLHTTTTRKQSSFYTHNLPQTYAIRQPPISANNRRVQVRTIKSLFKIFLSRRFSQTPFPFYKSEKSTLPNLSD